jgi:hypothetical protein
MMLIHCDQDCMFQKNGYCTVEPPSPIARYEPNGCVRCMQVLSRADYENGVPLTPEPPQKPPAHF